jgi:hypothetical protein
MSSINFEKNCNILTKNNENTLEKPDPDKNWLPPIIDKCFKEYLGIWHEPQFYYKNVEDGWKKCKDEIRSQYFKDFEIWKIEKDFKDPDTKQKVKSGDLKFYALHGLVCCYNDLQEEKQTIKFFRKENDKLRKQVETKFNGDTDLIDENTNLQKEIEILRKEKLKLKNKLLAEEEKVKRLLVSKKVVAPNHFHNRDPAIRNKERYDEIMSITGNPADDTSSEESNISIKITETETEEKLQKDITPSEKTTKKKEKGHFENMGLTGGSFTKLDDALNKIVIENTTKKNDEKPKKKTSKTKKASKKKAKTDKKIEDDPKIFNEKNKICEVQINNKTFDTFVDLYVTEDFAFYKDSNEKYWSVGHIELQKPPEYLQGPSDYTDERGYFKNVWGDDVVDFHINITEKGEKKLNRLMEKDGEGFFSAYDKDKIYKCIEWERHEILVEHKFMGFTNRPEPNNYELLVNMKEYNMEDYRN